jgi:CubicO group peptidase (beta-lactamase class C family)
MMSLTMYDSLLQTVFGIASMSKAFTAAALGLVMDDFAHGRNVTPLPEGLASFTWDTKLEDLLPNDWKLMDEDASQRARVRDILAYVSGLQKSVRVLLVLHV